MTSEPFPAVAWASSYPVVGEIVDTHKVDHARHVEHIVVVQKRDGELVKFRQTVRKLQEGEAS